MSPTDWTFQKFLLGCPLKVLIFWFRFTSAYMSFSFIHFSWSKLITNLNCFKTLARPRKCLHWLQARTGRRWNPCEIPTLFGRCFSLRGVFLSPRDFSVPKNLLTFSNVLHALNEQAVLVTAMNCDGWHSSTYWIKHFTGIGGSEPPCVSENFPWGKTLKLLVGLGPFWNAEIHFLNKALPKSCMLLPDRLWLASAGKA
jgi:hypothetical protein